MFYNVIKVLSSNSPSVMLTIYINIYQMLLVFRFSDVEHVT